MSALQTDLYQLTMAAGYFAARKVNEIAVFELLVRRLPAQRQFLIAAGLQQAVEYLLELRFSSEQIGFLRSLPQFERAQPGFWEYLREFRLHGDVFAMREGTPFYAGEPVLSIRAPLIEAQIPETFLLALLGFQSNVAAKAARLVAAAGHRPIVEFGSRRAHSPGAGVLAARAAFIGGCTATSNIEAGQLYGIPLSGTSAHSWVQSFASEQVAFRELQQLLGPETTLLIDTYDTKQGALRAVELKRPFWGVRLDSGDLLALSTAVRAILDQAGLSSAKIIATNDLDEHRIAELLASGAPIDAFGVGTQLATVADAAGISAVYKLAELEVQGIKRYSAKYSAEKKTYPGSKQVFRYRDRDIVGRSSECTPEPDDDEMPEALLKPVVIEGKLLEALPSTREARDYCQHCLSTTQLERPVSYSKELLRLAEVHWAGAHAL
jgi:nicotinate phosphoribosyltransferase